MKILIITGGRIDEDFALDLLNGESYDHVIVVDGALELWDKVGVRSLNNDSFDHLVGDFDTVSPDILDKYLGKVGVKVHRFIPEKDYTDTDIAVKLAISLCKAEENSADHDEIDIIGATGSRIDHMMANIRLLTVIEGSDIKGYIIDTYNRISLAGSRTVLKKGDQYGDYFSLLPVSEKCVDVTIRGAKYPLCKADVFWEQSLCVSNEIIDDEAVIEIGSGKAFLIESRDHE